MLVVRCPQCGTTWELAPTEADSEKFTCTECGKIFEIPEEIRDRVGWITDRLDKRYARMYSAARNTIIVGVLVKTASVCVFVLEIISLFATGFQSSGAYIWAWLAWAVISAAILYAFGQLLGVLGNILRANADAAVNSSKMLSSDQKIDIVLGRAAAPLRQG